MSEELKPCPFCGDEKGVRVMQEDECGEWFVVCKKCRTMTYSDRSCNTRDEAVSAWNRRSERTCRKVPGKSCYGERRPKCSECGQSIGDRRWAYCPKCGRRIEEES